MKKNLLLYGLVFSVLINIFQMVNSSNILKRSEEVSTISKKELKKAQDSIVKLLDDDKFSLDHNEYAQEYYFEHNLKALKTKVKEDLMAFNADKRGNKYVSYEQIGENPFLINNIKILNHRWIIANFSDGKVWGEVLIKYFINEDKPTDFETVETLIYQETLN
ncbi:hypothetical protein [Flavobacterium terrigena]|uniref:Hydrolase n=1 Tax=Flavobacterium terrigena TaxID=402734 RepID=A0A1H6UEC5_9FLAO|nr:hypothetical protein [Flavobacterium terrigena]SEI89024.1 hypothetical protein SAMN05660918_1829 [Flavobacterium terrigena]